MCSLNMQQKWIASNNTWSIERRSRSNLCSRKPLYEIDELKLLRKLLFTKIQTHKFLTWKRHHMFYLHRLYSIDPNENCFRSYWFVSFFSIHSSIQQSILQTINYNWFNYWHGRILQITLRFIWILTYASNWINIEDFIRHFRPKSG